MSTDRPVRFNHRWVGHAVFVLAATMLVGQTAFAQGGRTVKGITRDSASSAPLAGALVEVRSQGTRATARTDEEGNFRISSLPPGRYQLSAIRIGFSEIKREFDLGARDTTVVLSMMPISQQLDAFRVRGDVSAIYGMVGTLPDLLPLNGVKIQVIGANKTIVTDATGGFFIPVNDPGQYMVRMTREGFQERMFPIEVPRGRAVDGSRLLDPGAATPKGFDVLYKDMDSRLRQRAPASAALVPGAEIRRRGGNLIDALMSSPSFGEKGLRFGPEACVLINGTPRPAVTLESIRPEDVEAVEVYAWTSDTGRDADRSNTLNEQWPRGAACGQMYRSTVRGSKVGTAKYVVVWLRK